MEAASKLMTPGAVGVVPTDTVYGLVARAADTHAVERLYALKQRETKPGTLIAANFDQLELLGIKRRYLKAVEQFWPGPVSVVIPCANAELTYLHRGKQSLAIRIPADKKLTELLTKTGPLLTSSANKSGESPAKNVAEARSYFGATVDFYQDGGDLASRQPSTIIRIVDDAVEVLRQGATKIDNGTIST